MKNNFVINEILRRYESHIRMVIRRYFDNRMEIDDIFQDVILHIYKKVEHLNHETENKFTSKGFITTIIKNFCIDIKRVNSRSKIIDIKEDAFYSSKNSGTQYDNSFENSFFKDLTPINIEKGLLQLKGRDRQLIILRFYKKKSIKEIDSIMNKKHSAVYIKRALDNLKKIFRLKELPEDFDGFLIED
jgi:RNA polymerase sigma factor (sigma-70 family)